jgi:hypothetical protein
VFMVTLRRGADRVKRAAFRILLLAVGGVASA